MVAPDPFILYVLQFLQGTYLFLENKYLSCFFPQLQLTFITMFPGNKSNAVMEKFLSLPQSLDTVTVEYIWIDDTTEPIRSKCKTMNFEPKLPEGQGQCGWQCH